MTILRTERLTLRRAEATDLADLHQVMRHPDAMRYWSTPPHPDMATTRAWLDRLLAMDTAASVEFVVVLDGTVIGTAGGGYPARDRLYPAPRPLGQGPGV